MADFADSESGLERVEEICMRKRKLETRLREEEEERLRREAAEWRAKLGEITEWQRQRERELEELERLRAEALSRMRRSTETAAAAASPSFSREVCVPRFQQWAGN
ncbi:eukaryotic translation initiation factor 3 subunit A-like [Pyrus communis]|uniref:eukaryotic translation initiation factor 3 subunit A-like n=1 Tax=Pyrus communis TaxID=23211 RepID=UPI0035C15DA2